MKTKRIGYIALLVGIILGLFTISEIAWAKYQEGQTEKQAMEAEELANQQALDAEETLKNKLRSGDYNNENLKVVFLTFDDGPFYDTPEVLDILKDQDVKATFFTNGKTFDDFSAEYKRYVEDGHTLANHTFSHEYSSYDSPEAFLEDINNQRNYLVEQTGTEPAKIFRFPGGSGSAPQEIIDAVAAEGYNYVDWNVQYGDGKSDSITADEAFQGIIDGVHQNSVSVVLCHMENPYKSEARGALANAITQLKSEGYTFLPIEQDFKLPRFAQPSGSSEPVVPDPGLIEETEIED